jgi:hypothetical protein
MVAPAEDGDSTMLTTILAIVALTAVALKVPSRAVQIAVVVALTLLTR